MERSTACAFSAFHRAIEVRGLSSPLPFKQFRRFRQKSGSESQGNGNSATQGMILAPLSDARIRTLLRLSGFRPRWVISARFVDISPSRSWWGRQGELRRNRLSVGWPREGRCKAKLCQNSSRRPRRPLQRLPSFIVETSWDSPPVRRMHTTTQWFSPIDENR